MKRMLIFSAAAVATIGAAVPAVAGLAGNPSFSHKLPVHVPSQAQLVDFDDHGRAVNTSRAPEPGDDKGGLRTSATPEPGDDKGGLRTSATPEPGDDSGGHGGRDSSGRGGS